MASKQLGKLRQWAGEVISSKDKTIFTDEFRELEQDVELRRAGALRLLLASEGYHHNLSKRKANDALLDEKLLPLDTFGVVMCMHGEEFGDDSVYGTSLVNLGRAHCKVATLQEAYALTLQDTFVASLKKFGEDVKVYDQQRKKLESRRLTYDSAVTKFEKLKGSKKEKERREAEEEMERAKERFEETEEEVHTQMLAIQEKEIGQQKELTSLLDNELNFVERYLEVLKEVKVDWTVPVEKRSSGPFPSSRRPGTDSRQNSVRSKRSTRSAIGSDEEIDIPQIPLSRKSSNHSTSNSRPSSRLSKKRAGSTAGHSDVEDKEKEKEKPDKAKRLSMSGWASNAMGSMITRKSKDKDRFTTLQEDGDRDQADESRAATPNRSSTPSLGIISHIKNKSRDNIPTGSSPKPSSRILKPLSLQDNGKKIVRAVYDFSGAADELSFKVGDEITVLNEVLEGWWMGELDGKKGLFPTAYVDVLPPKPSVPPRNGREDSPLKGNPGGDSDDGEGYGTSDLDDDRDLSAPPLTPRHSPFYGGPSDTVSIASDQVDEEELQHHAVAINGRKVGRERQISSPPSRKATSPIVPAPNTSPTPPFKRATTTDGTVTPKKAPPPPPPRRASNAGVLMAQGAIPLPMPEKRPGVSVARSNSSTSGSGTSNSGSMLLASGSIGRRSSPASSAGNDYDTSPFESESDSLHTPPVSNSRASGAGLAAQVKASPSGCVDFRQNPFKTQGYCNNCFEYHV
ncbi:BAR-domain-containing protein [Pluteus cervinus]|uniref:BAR-domain-containing protein n=1 Tax=Pluteus cervinus TaxID=181527 RepID=A0ACD3ATB5_9AGAR|nr:BAR-domain-containing protein [Pluteus cervinus]